MSQLLSVLKLIFEFKKVLQLPIFVILTKILVQDYVSKILELCAEIAVYHDFSSKICKIQYDEKVYLLLYSIFIYIVL